jgi:putative ABC transport system permease protein
LPPKVVKGSLKSLWNDNTIALDVLGAQLLSKGMSKPLDVGDIVNVNDHEVKVVAILNAYPAFSTAPHGYLTYTEANQILPESRHNLSYIIVEPKEGYTNEMVIHEIETKTPLKAYTSSEFAWKTIWWITQNTGIVLSFATTIILGFIVGIVVAGQTFYSFIYENSGNLAALKAMGISDALMQKMIFMQVFIAGFIGYGIGLFFTSVFGVFTFIYPILPFYINYTTLFLTFLLVVSICFFSAYLGIKKITSVSPAEVFRG